MKIALIGNQNSGKTTLFNYLTGMNAKIGNWPGVTIEKKEGKIVGFTEELWIKIENQNMRRVNSFSEPT